MGLSTRENPRERSDRMLGVGNYTVCLDTVVYASIHVGEHCLSNQGDYEDITFVVYEYMNECMNE